MGGKSFRWCGECGAYYGWGGGGGELLAGGEVEVHTLHEVIEEFDGFLEKGETT